MDIGLTVFLTDRVPPPARIAAEAERRGFASLFFPEHTHIPVSRRTPPPAGEQVLPEEYARTLDPFVALATAAAVTTRIRLGTGVALVAQHDPVSLAKTVATLDLLSGGRVALGIGFGWNREEMADHGIAFDRRRDVVREHVLAMRALWRDDVAEFTGEFVRLAPSWAWPKPVQRPGPPVLVGGGPTDHVFAAVAEYGDGWLPIGGSGLAEAIPRLRDRVSAAGRDPDAVKVVPFGTLPDAGKLARYRDLGVTEVVLRLPAVGEPRMWEVLDDYAGHLG